RQMKDLLVTARRPNTSAPRPYDDALMPAVHPLHVVKGELAIQEFNGDWPWTPDFSTLKPTHSGVIKSIAIPPKLEPFGEQLTGYLSVEKAGEYTFTATADGGLHIWLHDARVIDSDHCKPYELITARVRLAAGLHPLRISYSHRTGEPLLILLCSGPDMKEHDLRAPDLARNGAK
ncbi:MAG TPA: PA14 domain-containing protein, partial [Tepidisphaeraceae bacterium]|nr:PA14 domain-containing protein [Tepidisphaeraceae bacterium]